MDRNKYKLISDFLKNKPWLLPDMPMIFALEENDGQIYYGVFTLSINSNILTIYKGKKGLEGFRFMCEANDDDDVYKIRERYFSQDAITVVIDENKDHDMNEISDYLINKEMVLSSDEILEFYRLRPNHIPEVLKLDDSTEKDFIILRDAFIASNILFENFTSGKINRYTFTPIRNYRGVIPKIVKKSDRVFHVSKHVLPKLEENPLKETLFNNPMMTARLNALPRGESWVIDICYGPDPIWVDEETEERIFPSLFFGLSLASENMLVHMIPANFKDNPEDVLLEICKIFIEEENLPAEILVESESAMALLKDFARKLNIPINMSELSYLDSVKEDSYDFMQNQDEMDKIIAQDYQTKIEEILGDISNLNKEEIKELIQTKKEQIGITSDFDLDLILDILEEKNLILSSDVPATLRYLIDFDNSVSLVRTRDTIPLTEFVVDIIRHYDLADTFEKYDLSEDTLFIYDVKRGFIPLQEVGAKSLREINHTFGPNLTFKLGEFIITLKFKDRINSPTDKTVFTDGRKNEEN